MLNYYWATSILRWRNNRKCWCYNCMFRNYRQGVSRNTQAFIYFCVPILLTPVGKTFTATFCSITRESSIVSMSQNITLPIIILIFEIVCVVTMPFNAIVVLRIKATFPTLAFVTFDLRNQPLGTYRILGINQADSNSLDTTSLSNGFEIGSRKKIIFAIAGSGPQCFYQILKILPF